jgi:hypothetical protein
MKHWAERRNAFLAEQRKTTELETDIQTHIS